jgi:uncharacterized membrane protein required for colicin V production
VNILPDIITEVNWIDIIYVILFLGIVYKGTRTGVGGQLLSLAGWIVLLFVSIKYYSLVSEALFGFLLQSWAKPLSFLIIGVVGFVLIKFLERVFSVVAGSELSSFERIGGALVAVVRAFVFFGAIGIFLLLVPVDIARDSVIYGSKSGMFFVEFDAGIYSMITEVTGDADSKRSKDDVIKEILSVTGDLKQ